MAITLETRMEQRLGYLEKSRLEIKSMKYLANMELGANTPYADSIQSSRYTVPKPPDRRASPLDSMAYCSKFDDPTTDDKRLRP